MTPKKTLKKWFSNLMKPAQEHFAAWIDSYWHKSEQIPMSNIDGLSRAIENTASAKQLLNHLEDTNAHRNLFDKKVDKEEGKGLSANDFTNEHKQKLEGLQPTDVSGLLPKGGYDGTGQQLKEAIDGLQTKIGQVETTLSVDDTAFDTLQEIVTQVKSNKNLEQLLTGKVDKEEGKGLSQENFTTELANKIIELEKQVNVFKSIIDKDGDDIIIKTTPNIRVVSTGASIYFKIFEEGHDILISKDYISLGEKRLYTSADITNPSLNEFITNSVVHR
jgi:hypothetical protein